MDKQNRISGGYIILCRNVIESEVWRKPPLYLKVWIYLIARAQYTVYKDMKRGQLFTSIPKIQEACAYYIGYRKVTPTKDQIFNIIDWMRNQDDSNSGNENDKVTGMITTLKATHGMLITIENYNYYQNPKNYASNNINNNEETIETTAISDNINKHYNSSNNVTNYISEGKKIKQKNIKKNKFHDFIQSDEDLIGSVLENHAKKRFMQALNNANERKNMDIN